MHMQPQVNTSAETGLVNETEDSGVPLFGFFFPQKKYGVKELTMWKNKPSSLVGACTNPFLAVAAHWSNKLNYHTSM